ncbi:MAG: hypothetical protein ABJO57_10130 [Lentilitoribacter sp.]
MVNLDANIFFAILYPILAVCCFTAVVVLVDPVMWDSWARAYEAAIPRQSVRTAIVCLVFSTIGSLLIMEAFHLNPSVAFISVATATLFSHVFIAFIFQDKEVSLKLLLIGCAMTALIVWFGVEMGKLPEKQQVAQDQISSALM